MGVKRYLNMSFQEFLQLIPLEVISLREILIELAKEEKSIMEDAEKNSESKIKKMSSANGLDDLLEGEY